MLPPLTEQAVEPDDAARRAIFAIPRFYLDMGLTAILYDIHHEYCPQDSARGCRPQSEWNRGRRKQ